MFLILGTTVTSRDRNMFALCEILIHTIYKGDDDDDDDDDDEAFCSLQLWSCQSGLRMHIQVIITRVEEY